MAHTAISTMKTTPDKNLKTYTQFASSTEHQHD